MAPAILPEDVLGVSLGSVDAYNILRARDPQTNGNKADPSTGVINPHNINNTVIFVLFGLIGAAIVCAGVWFFFVAKNGGFYFKQGDWDDYKSTVLRRKGPNGTLLSGATPSTNLGGGSIYKDIDDGTTTVTDSTGLSGITGGVSDVAGRERRRLKRERKIREKETKRAEKDSARRHVGEDGILIDEEAERVAKDQLRHYRHERPARVGGLNKQSDGSAWDSSANPTESNVSSDLLSNRQATPTNTPTKSGGGIRKVYSTADRTADREAERIRAEARKLQEKGRAAGRERRDFSWQRAESSTVATESPTREGRVPGSWNGSEVSTDIGTKSYHHPIPELKGADRPEEQKKRGYRRGRDDAY